MLTAAVEYPAAMAASACRTSAADRSRSFRVPTTARIGSSTFVGGQEQSGGVLGAELGQVGHGR